MSFYSDVLEPLTQTHQTVQLDLTDVQEHVKRLLEIIKLHRKDARKHFREDIF